MKPAPFAYHRARSVDEAVARLAELGDEAKIRVLRLVEQPGSAAP